MRVGFVTKWFNRGQPVVARQLRDAVAELGHETFVLARPKKQRGPMKGALQRDGVWDQPNVDEAAAYEVTGEEYERWVERRGIDLILCDQNYQFAELASLRRAGVTIVGRFVWEMFTEAHVAGAREAYDLVYSMTRCEQERYRGFGLETPYVPWGIHPELLAVEGRRRYSEDLVQVIFPAGFIGHRKPLEPALEAFERTTNPRLRLLVKAQVERKSTRVVREAAARDSRIEFLLTDQPTEEHLATFAGSDVCLTPARWEGLGLPLFEATAFGLPVITNDFPPLNEVIEDGRNGILVANVPHGTAESGIPAYDPDISELTAAIERVAEDGVRAQLAAGAREVREERGWAATVAGICGLIETATAAKHAGTAA